MEVRKNPVLFSLQSGLLTALTLAGGLAAAFLLGNLLFESFNVHMSGLSSGLIAFPVFLVCLIGGGALWGYAMAKILKVEGKKLVRPAALAYGGTVILVGILLELAFGLVSLLTAQISLPIHIAFTVVFVTAAGLIAGLLSGRMAGWLGREEIKRQVGQASGLGAALGFLAVNMVMLALGWKVGAPGAAERFTMITVMLSSNFGAALVGGSVLGWILQKEA
jgi:hypothetical protein